MRTPIIIGNWKMNKTVGEALDLVRGIHYGLRFPGNVDVVVAPPFTALFEASEILKKLYIAVSGQDLFWEVSGAYTGEVSGAMLKEAGADYVIIGHSERRQYFGETDDNVNKKALAALKNNLIPIVCVGETLTDRENGEVESVIERQLVSALSNLSEDQALKIIIAYEPVWAIGTGKTATPAEAEEVHLFIRKTIARDFGNNTAEAVRIVYGGSVKPSNAREILSMPDIDGALVGGACLNAEDFIGIIKSV